MVLPLQPQHASQQSVATYYPISITPVSSSRQDDVMRRRNMWTLYAFCWLWPWTPLYRSLTHRRSLSRVALLRLLTIVGYCSRRSGLAPLSLSGRPTVLGRHVSLRVWSRTQITLALQDCMVLISVNAVLRLLKRSMCIRGRTHSVVCRYQPVWRRATIALRWLVFFKYWYSEGAGRAATRPVPSRCTKCNSLPINSQCTNFIPFDEAL